MDLFVNISSVMTTLWVLVMDMTMLICLVLVK